MSKVKVQRRAQLFITFVHRISLALILGSSITAVAEEPVPELVRRIKPAVVTILTFSGGQTALMQGSGFFIGANQVISNRHVFEGAYRAEVKAADGHIYAVKGVLADERDSDLILLQVDVPPGVFSL